MTYVQLDMDGIPYMTYVPLVDGPVSVDRVVIKDVMKADRLSHNAWTDILLVSESVGPQSFDLPSDSYMKILNRD